MDQVMSVHVDSVLERCYRVIEYMCHKPIVDENFFIVRKPTDPILTAILVDIEEIRREARAYNAEGYQALERYNLRGEHVLDRGPFTQDHINLADPSDLLCSHRLS